MTTNEYLQSPYNLHCHNLCENLKPPLGFNILLGLGLNFCIEQNQPKPNVQYTLEKLKRSIRLKEWLEENGSSNNDDDEYIPHLYLPSRWNPPPASNKIESKLQQFSTKLEETVQNNITIPKTNLSRLQYTCLRNIKNDHRFIVCLSDKNLGPVIMEHTTYFQRCLKDHLNCRTTYVQLTEEEATERVNRTRQILLQLRLDHRKDLSDAENTYFWRNANLKHRLPQFYLTIKVLTKHVLL